MAEPLVYLRAEVAEYAPGVGSPETGDTRAFQLLDDRELALGREVACGEGALWVQEVQPSGRRRMPVGEWHRGRGVQSGDRFGG